MAPRLLIPGLILVASTLATSAMAQQRDAPFRARMRQNIEERFIDRLRTELQLTDTQERHLRDISRVHAARRVELEERQVAIRDALQSQLRPGVAADKDSVQRLLSAMMEARIGYLESFRDELTALTPVLDPVQRAQFFFLRDRVYQRAQEIREQRPGARRPF
jgi:hypothetical protein